MHKSLSSKNILTSFGSLQRVAVRCVAPRSWLPGLLTSVLCAGAVHAQSAAQEQAQSEEQEQRQSDDEERSRPPIESAGFEGEYDYPVNRFEITPFAGFAFGGEFEDPTDDTDRDLENDPNYGLIVDVDVGDTERHYEFLYSNQRTAVEGATDLDLEIQYIQIGGIVDYPDAGWVRPYFGLTVGATLFNPDAAGFDNETEFSFSVGGGFKAPITERIGLRFDARAFITVLDPESSFFCISAPPDSACRIQTKSETFVQFSAGLGVTVGF